MRSKQSKAINVQRLSKRELAIGALLWPERVRQPATRGECRSVARPCPYVGCKYHLFLDELPSRSLLFNHPAREPSELSHSCSLDVADLGGATLEEVGAVLGITRERVRQIQERALVKLRTRGVLLERLKDADA